MVRLCFGREDNLRSKLIRWSTAGLWSHVWFELELFNQRWVLHSAVGGVCLVPPSRLPAYTATAVVELPVAVSELLVAARARMGAGYDFGVIPNGLLLVAFRLTGIRWFDPVRNGNRFSCSEFAALVLQQAGMDKLSHLDPELTTPGMLAQALEEC